MLQAWPLTIKEKIQLPTTKEKKHGKKAVDTDHMTLRLNLDINVFPQKLQRVQMFDFKNVIGQELFKRKTSETTDFTDCFKNNLPLLEQCDNWFQTLKTHCKKSYPIIRNQSKTVKSSSAECNSLHAYCVKNWS